MKAGTSTIRTIVASRNTATARPRADSLIGTSRFSRNDRNTTIMIAAAAVMIPPVCERPQATAARSSPWRS
jgi:hypothetical protein